MAKTVQGLSVAFTQAAAYSEVYGLMPQRLVPQSHNQLCPDRLLRPPKRVLWKSSIPRRPPASMIPDEARQEWATQTRFCGTTKVNVGIAVKSTWYLRVFLSSSETGTSAEDDLT